MEWWYVESDHSCLKKKNVEQNLLCRDIVCHKVLYSVTWRRKMLQQRTLIHNLYSIFYQLQLYSDIEHEIYHQLNHLSNNGQYWGGQEQKEKNGMMISREWS